LTDFNEEFTINIEPIVDLSHHEEHAQTRKKRAQVYEPIAMREGSATRARGRSGKTPKNKVGNSASEDGDDLTQATCDEGNTSQVHVIRL